LNAIDKPRLSGPVIVVGAGISGLCTAHWLKKRGFEVVLFEKDSEPGGTMQTAREGGWLIEAGPNSALESTPFLQQLFMELGIVESRIYADPAASRRYILRRGELQPIPMSPASLLLTRLWSVKGRLRILKEPFVGRAPEDESVADFVTRRLGSEFLDYAINPFVAGVYAGDPRKLSIRAAFPKMHALEANYGGLIRGMLALRKERQGPKISAGGSRLLSFSEGMQMLPRSIAAELGDTLELNAEVEQIIPMRAGRNPVHVVTVRRNGKSESMQASAVVLASPAAATSAIIRPIDPEMSRILGSIYYPPVASVFLGFRNEQIGRPLDGFGFLVPEVEQRKILGTIWSSALFPGRAPDDCAALTTFVGGARQPDLASLDDDGLRNLVLNELQLIMNVRGDPVFCRINRWEHAIPQYTMGYEKVLHAIERFEQNFRGAFICSNFRGGIAVGDCVANGSKISENIVRYLSG
jgi:protoporphyrinogen/coproporphyrinogen III oxidase